MNKEETNELLSLIGEVSLDNTSVAQLEQFINNHPYFSAAQLLLAKKMLREKHPGLQKQLTKTALYFPNETWLRYLLLEETESNYLLTTAYQQDLSGSKFLINKKENTEDINLLTLTTENVLVQMPDLTTIREEPEEAPLDEEETAAQLEPLPIDESNQKIASLLSEQAEKFIKPIDGDETVSIQSEPFHAVDYFASQGIELESKKEGTNFDTKVHKFTDWLRQMKRINPHPIDLGTDVEQESYVANIAATSNQTKDVVTESMAEVLMKQNKNDKAVEIYEKLSLLYPFKNAYFAAKIEQLKQ